LIDGDIAIARRTVLCARMRNLLRVKSFSLILPLFREIIVVFGKHLAKFYVLRISNAIVLHKNSVLLE
jgi:hypothetical protein